MNIATDFPAMYSIYQLFEGKKKELTNQEAELIQKNIAEIDQKLKGQVIQNRKQYGEQIQAVKDKQNMVERKIRKTYEEMRKQSIESIKTAFKSKCIKFKEEFERQQIDFYQSQLQKLRKQRTSMSSSYFFPSKKASFDQNKQLMMPRNATIFKQKIEILPQNFRSSNNHVFPRLIHRMPCNSPKNQNINSSSLMKNNRPQSALPSFPSTVSKNIFFSASY